jgi:hypothetical protein
MSLECNQLGLVLSWFVCLHTTEWGAMGNYSYNRGLNLYINDVELFIQFSLSVTDKRVISLRYFVRMVVVNVSMPAHPRRFGFTGCQQEKNVTRRNQEWLWLQGICEEVVVVVLFLLCHCHHFCCFCHLILICYLTDHHLVSCAECI